MSKPYLRFVGDPHQQLKELMRLSQEAEYTICVGDVGFDYTYLIENAAPSRLKCVAGNHDNYTKHGGKFIHMQSGHWLGDYGTYTAPEFGDIFFVRGGLSIDKNYRTEGIDWYPDEELSYEKMNDALDSYLQTKPEFVVTHECPGQITDIAFGQKIWDGALLKPSMTAKLLDRMLEAHSPKTWIFGHHHRWWKQTVFGTQFICLPELGYVDFEKK